MRYCCFSILSISNKVACQTAILGKRFRNILIRGYYIPEDLLELVYCRGGIISGSAILKFLSGLKFDVGDLDIFIPEQTYSQMEQYFSSSNRWEGSFNTISTPNGAYIDHQKRVTPFYKIVEYNLRGRDRRKKKQPNGIKIQIIYLNAGINIKKHIRATFDLDILKNYFDGHKLSVDYPNDVITHETCYTVSSLLTGIPIANCYWRIKKYKERGIKFKNVSSTIISLYDIDSVIDKCRCQITKVNNVVVNTMMPFELYNYLSWYNHNKTSYKYTYEELYLMLRYNYHNIKHISHYMEETKLNVLVKIGKQLGYRTFERYIDFI